MELTGTNKPTTSPPQTPCEVLRVHCAVPEKRATHPPTPFCGVAGVAAWTARQRYGGHSEGETPGPIPNPEAKPLSADGTARETVWESRSPPDTHSQKGPPRPGVALSASPPTPECDAPDPNPPRSGPQRRTRAGHQVGCDVPHLIAREWRAQRRTRHRSRSTATLWTSHGMNGVHNVALAGPDRSTVTF